jgi:DNA-binding HxlR family transcriptional regulator
MPGLAPNALHGRLNTLVRRGVLEKRRVDGRTVEWRVKQ